MIKMMTIEELILMQSQLEWSFNLYSKKRAPKLYDDLREGVKKRLDEVNAEIERYQNCEPLKGVEVDE